MNLDIGKGMFSILFVLIIIFVGLLRNPIETFVGVALDNTLDNLRNADSNLAARIGALESKANIVSTPYQVGAVKGPGLLDEAAATTPKSKIPLISAIKKIAIKQAPVVKAINKVKIRSGYKFYTSEPSTRGHLEEEAKWTYLNNLHAAVQSNDINLHKEIFAEYMALLALKFCFRAKIDTGKLPDESYVRKGRPTRPVNFWRNHLSLAIDGTSNIYTPLSQAKAGFKNIIEYDVARAMQDPYNYDTFKPATIEDWRRLSN